MARVKIFNSFNNLDPKEFIRWCSAFVIDLVTQFNGKIDFVENIRASGIHEVVFIDSADIVSVPHNLGRVPDGFIVINLSAPITVYKPAGAAYGWTDTTIYLQASAGATASIYII